jgi:hypothetical protein
VGPGPLAVGVDPEAAVRLLAGQQRPGLGPLQELGRVGGRGRAIPVAEQLPAGQVADGRLVAGEQPRLGGRGWIIARAVHSGVIAEPDANRAAANKNRPKIGNTPSVRCGWMP